MTPAHNLIPVNFLQWKNHIYFFEYKNETTKLVAQRRVNEVDYEVDCCTIRSKIEKKNNDIR